MRGNLIARHLQGQIMDGITEMQEMEDQGMRGIVIPDLLRILEGMEDIVTIGTEAVILETAIDEEATMTTGMTGDHTSAGEMIRATGNLYLSRRY